MSRSYPYIDSEITLSNKIRRAIWNVVFALFFKPFGTKFFNRWRCLLLRLFGAEIGKDSGVYSSVKIWAPWNLSLGNNSWIGPYSVCYNMASIEIADDVTISQNSYLCTASHRIDEVNNPQTSLVVAPIKIERMAWLASQSFIGPGVNIGEGAIVGACAVLTQDAEPWGIYAGNPAKYIKKRVLKDE